jgi:hypothetical protein
VRLRRARLKSGRKIGAWRNYGPGGRLTDDGRRAWAARVRWRLRASWMMGKRLPGCGSRMNGRGWPWLARTGCRTRRRSDRYARTQALRSRRRGRWCGSWLLRDGLVRRQGLSRAGKNLAWPGRRRGNRSGWRRNGAQRSRWRRQRKARRMRNRRIRTRRSRAWSYRRMDRRAASEHWRTQGNGSRSVIFRVSLFFFGSFWQSRTGCCRLALMSVGGRGG